jgi:hypothetical protein
VLPIINCPKCQKPLERGYLKAEWVVANQYRIATVLREIHEAEKQGKGGDYYGGRAFSLIYAATPGVKHLHCLVCLDCQVVVCCARDDAADDFPVFDDPEETKSAL